MHEHQVVWVWSFVQHYLSYLCFHAHSEYFYIINKLAIEYAEEHLIIMENFILFKLQKTYFYYCFFAFLNSIYSYLLILILIEN